jgi:hypothetical protein
VAEAVHRAVVDPGLRGTVVDVAGRTCTFNQLAAEVTGGSSGRPARPRHVPRPVLHVVARAGPTSAARMARAALVMDTYPFTHSGAGAGRAGGSGAG